MKKAIRIVLSVFGALILLAALLFGVFIYRTEYAKTEIGTSCSDDRSRELVIYQIGEPEFPFGAGKVGFALSEDGRRINGRDIVIYNDGKQPREDDFTVSWDTDKVTVTVSAEEMDDITFSLYFDGRSEPEQ